MRVPCDESPVLCDKERRGVPTAALDVVAGATVVGAAVPTAALDVVAGATVVGAAVDVVVDDIEVVVAPTIVDSVTLPSDNVVTVSDSTGAVVLTAPATVVVACGISVVAGAAAG